MVGIVTISGQVNYGQILQNYAVNSVINKLGFETENLVESTSVYPSPVKRAREEAYLFLKKKSPEGYRTALKFIRFRQKYLKDRVISIDKIDCPSYESLVFGSDQIWNFSFPFTKERLWIYTGGFAENIPKIAFSASIGIDNIPDDCANRFVRNISNFRAVSVREESAVDIVSGLTGKNAVLLADPTAAVPKSEWESISRCPAALKKKEKYLLTYFIGQISPERQRYIKTAAAARGLKVVNIYLRECNFRDTDVMNIMLSPEEFLWAVEHCECFLTDSFHGCMFSLIFGRPFRCFVRVDGCKDMNSRFKTLFNTFELGDQCIGRLEEPPENLFSAIDCGGILERETRKITEFLQEALNH